MRLSIKLLTHTYTYNTCCQSSMLAYNSACNVVLNLHINCKGADRNSYSDYTYAIVVTLKIIILNVNIIFP